MRPSRVRLLVPAAGLFLGLISFGQYTSGNTEPSGWDPGALAGGPRIAWRSEVGFGHSAVVVKDDRLFTMGHTKRGEGEAAVELDVVVCLDLDTGEELWRYEYPCNDIYFSGPRATPELDGRAPLYVELGRTPVVPRRGQRKADLESQHRRRRLRHARALGTQRVPGGRGRVADPHRGQIGAGLEQEDRRAHLALRADRNQPTDPGCVWATRKETRCHPARGDSARGRRQDRAGGLDRALGPGVSPPGNHHRTQDVRSPWRWLHAV